MSANARNHQQDDVAERDRQRNPQDSVGALATAMTAMNVHYCKFNRAAATAEK